MTDLTRIFGGQGFSAALPHADPVDIQVSDAMRAAGIDPPKSLKIDGQIHRFSTKGRKKDDSGYYIIFPDNVPAGVFGCWRDDIRGHFVADIGRELTPAEEMAHRKRMKEAKDARDAARERKAEVAAEGCEYIWERAAGAEPVHPYLQAKGVQPHGARMSGDGRLIIPMRAADGSLSSLQYIDQDGVKKFHDGGKASGAHWVIGDTTDDIVYVAEGFATAATVIEELGGACAIAFSAHNLPATVSAMVDRYGDNVVIIADNDESRTGQKYAEQCWKTYGVRYVMPPEAGDINDYRAAGGDVAALVHPPQDDWLVPADEFSGTPAPLTWHIKHWLPQGSLIMVHGPSGGGKTFVVLDMVCHIAGEVDHWFDHKVNHGTVVYLAGEGHYGMRGRIAAWKQASGVDHLDMYISKSGLDLNKPSGYAKVRDQLRALPSPPVIVVVDTLHRFLDGDENSAQDTKTMLDACAALMAEFGCSVLLVHHTGVSDEAQHRARGSSAWRGALDVEISVAPPKRAGSISVIQRKQKDAELQPAIFVDLSTVDLDGWMDEDGEQVSSAVLMKGDEPPSIDTPLAKKKKQFQRAWTASGGEVDQSGRPYITSSALKNFLVDQEGKTPSTAASYVKVSYEGGLVSPLCAAEILAASENGFCVVDQTWASALLLLKKAPAD